MNTQIKGEYNFKKDLSKGEEGEEIVIKYMQGLGYEFKNKCSDNRYDFCMSYDDGIYSYELKTDMYCTPANDTGNLVVEIECRGKSSGLSVTQANYFVTYFPHLGEIWNIRTEELRKLIQYFNVPLKEGKGDPGSNTKFYLIKKETYRQYFKVHKI
jgi:hypothetical protein